MVASVFAGGQKFTSNAKSRKNNDYLTIPGNSPLAAAAR
jgi:hypothetical protein